jgi:dienelactone hydrolase
MAVHRPVILLASALLLGGCSSNGALRMDQRHTSADIAIANPVSFTDAGTGLTVAARVVYPKLGRHLPVVLFSHGAYSSKDEYNLILDDWAAHGYVVIAPTHRDSTTLGVQRGSNDPRRFQWRLDDMTLLLSQLDQLGGKVPGLTHRVDTETVVAAGHSFGGLVAQTLGGASFFEPASGKTITLNQPRIKAVIVFSGAGRLPPILRSEDFATLKLPTLVTVGTDDLKQSEISGYRWRREPYDLMPRGSRYLLVLQGADHYLGGLVCRSDLPKKPLGPQWLSLFNQTTVAFMDAALRRDSAAAARLQSLLDATAAGKNLLAQTWHNDEVGD